MDDLKFMENALVKLVGAQNLSYCILVQFLFNWAPVVVVLLYNFCSFFKCCFSLGFLAYQLKPRILNGKLCTYNIFKIINPLISIGRV